MPSSYLDEPEAVVLYYAGRGLDGHVRRIRS
jgi:hypothetical protein